eukprot:TRINITY_DN17609_c0_g1_i5.p1 TRINITY_DN17609_c0_g1~~TRINITY_DN17609_c0_g1_i5.p1  ORF type:complete len:296 (+),score=53.42 TRINITY_DN17609_c0_g1_i5:139-1026(+)
MRMLEEGSATALDEKVFSPIKTVFNKHYETAASTRLDVLMKLSQLEEKKTLVQQAIVVQGLRYNNSKERRELKIDLRYPEEFLEETAAECRKQKYQERLAEKMKRLAIVEAERKKKERIELAEREAKEFLTTHAGVPNLFTEDDIRRHNKERPVTDQLELMSGGLLRHHCAFPKCLFYLKNLATPEDLEKGHRNGLYHHFRGFFYPKNSYMRGLHKIGDELWKKNPNRTQDNFVSEMIKKLDLKHYAEGEVGAKREVIALYSQLKTAQQERDRKSGSAGMPRPISYAVFCLKKKK